MLIFGTEPEPAQPRDRATCQGDVILPGYYQDGAVFQSGKPSQVWGFTTTRECSIFVTQVCGKGYNKISYAATGDFELDPSGGERYLWKVRLPARLSGEECVLNAKQGNSIKSVSVVYGDVYVCSGQSNMEFAMGSIANASSEMNLSKDYSNIRMFKVPHAYSPLAQEDIYPLAGNAWFDPSDQWRLSRFSAVCFLYAR